MISIGTKITKKKKKSPKGVDEVLFFSIEDDQGYSWSQVEFESNRISRLLDEKGLKPGDRIALVMQNHPRYFWTWLGAAKIGVTSALINYNLKDDALLHALKLSEAKVVFFDDEFSESVKEISQEYLSFASQTVTFYHCEENGTFGSSITKEISNISGEPLESNKLASNRGVKFTDPILLVYTSGTTGPSKAVRIPHLRFNASGILFALLWKVTSSDRVYTPLPLYHFAGGVLGISTTIQAQGKIFVRKKFSVSRFSDDVIKHQISIVQYIGELCRYLLNSPEKPIDSQTNIRLALGNGLRPDIWPKFKKRFGIKQIGEFYGATESPAVFANIFDKEGSMGYCSPFLQKLQKIAIIQYDIEKDEVIRKPDGLCIRVPEGGIGELVAKPSSMAKKSVGYTNKEATEKKFLHNVLSQGDQWFRTGDLVKIDKEGWVYFVDRLGDTFRWKGENVATSDVEDVISRFEFNHNRVIEEVTVYGVQIPDTDGRAGMACIRYTGDLEKFPWTEYEAYVTKHLPSYAVPIFIRITNELPITGTYKYSKSDLKKQGYNPSDFPNELFYYFEHSLKTYQKINPSVYEDIVAGHKKF